MVTTAHHMPSKIPRQKHTGNCSEFDRLSLERKRKVLNETLVIEAKDWHTHVRQKFI